MCVKQDLFLERERANRVQFQISRELFGLIGVALRRPPVAYVPLELAQHVEEHCEGPFFVARHGVVAEGLEERT
jgi:hypothetical protein